MTGAVVSIQKRFLKPTLVAFALALSGAALEAQAGPPLVHFNSNHQDVPLAPFPGVTVASLKLEPGEYLAHVKLRYRGDPVGGEATAGCVFEGTGAIGRDASETRVQLIGWPGTRDGVMMTYILKNPGDDPGVRVQCFGDATVHVINSQFAAMPVTLDLQP